MIKHYSFGSNSFFKKINWFKSMQIKNTKKIKSPLINFNYFNNL